MRLDYIDPIVNSAIAVLSEFTGGPVERGGLSLKKSSSPSMEVAAVIGMAGEVEGRVILEMARDTALSVAAAMNHEELTEIDNFVLDTLMEFANIMVARGVSALNDRGFSFRLTSPIIFTGSNLSFANSLDLETLVIPLRANAGEMTLNVSFRMTDL